MELAVACLKWYPRNELDELRESTANCDQIVLCSGRDLSPVPSEYDVGC
jgi:hypothetical protein